MSPLLYLSSSLFSLPTYSPSLPTPPKASLNATLDSLYAYTLSKPTHTSSLDSFRTAWEDDDSDASLEWVKGIKATLWRFTQLLEEVWFEGLGDLDKQNERDGKTTSDSVRLAHIARIDSLCSFPTSSLF